MGWRGGVLGVKLSEAFMDASGGLALLRRLVYHHYNNRDTESRRLRVGKWCVVYRSTALAEGRRKRERNLGPREPSNDVRA